METFFAVSAVMNLVDNITGPLRRVRGGMASTERQAGSLSGSMGLLTKTLLPLTVAAGIFLGAIAPGIGTAANFEAAISQVGAVSQAVPADLARLEQAALNLGSTTAWSASQVAEAEKYLSMAGFSIDDNIAALPGVLNMASAGATDLGQAADISSDILSAFKLEAGQMNRVADVLTATFTTANTDLVKLGETMKYVAPVAQRAGLSLEATSAMAGLLGNIGIKSTMAGTAMRTMLTNLAAPASDASKALKQLGVETIDQLTGNLKNPVMLMADLSGAMEGLGSGQQLSILEKIFGREAMTGASEILDQAGMGDLTKYIKIIEDSTGTASKVAQAQLDNLRGAVTILGSAWEGLQISIGKIFLPVLTPLTLGISKIVGLMSKLAQTTIGKSFIAIGAALSVGVIGLTLYTAASYGLSLAIPMLKAGLVSLAAVLAGISWPIWALVAAVIGLFTAFKTNFMGMGDVITGWWTNIKLVAQGVAAVFATLKNQVGTIEGVLSQEIKAAGLAGFVTTVSKVLYRFWSMYSGFWEALKSSFSDIGNMLAPIWQGIVEAFEPFGPIFEAAGRMIATVANWLGIASIAADASGWRLYGEIIGTVVGAAFKFLAGAVGILLTAVQMVMGPIGGLVTFLVEGLKLVGTAFGWIVTKIESIGSLLSGINWSEHGAKLMETFASGIKSAISGPVDLVKTGLTKIRNMLPFSDAKEGPLSALTASGRAIMSTMATGVQAGIPSLSNAVKAGTAAAAAAMVVAAAPAVASPALDIPQIPAISIPVSAAIDTGGLGMEKQTSISSGLAVLPQRFQIPGLEISEPDSGQGQTISNTRISNNKSSSKQLVINISNITLPNVSSANDFVDELKRLVEGYDV